MTIRTYMDLEAWQQGIELALELYRWTDEFPKYERFGISSQLRRAAVSIRCNVAEGQCKSRNEFQHHVSHSRGSLQELSTLVVIAERRHYGSEDLLTKIRIRADREGRLLSGLRRSLL